MFLCCSIYLQWFSTFSLCRLLYSIDACPGTCGAAKPKGLKGTNWDRKETKNEISVFRHKSAWKSGEKEDGFLQHNIWESNYINKLKEMMGSAIALKDFSVSFSHMQKWAEKNLKTFWDDKWFPALKWHTPTLQSQRHQWRRKGISESKFRFHMTSLA